MRPQAHIPTVSVGARDWRAATIALVSLLGAAMLLVALESGVLLNNPLFDRLRASPIAANHPSIANRVSLDFHLLSHPINPTRRFSVAHSLPADVTSSLRFSVGGDARVAFGIFGETALNGMLADEGTVGQLKPQNDRLLMMLMLMQLHQHRN
ncbi:hypothetical protein [Candidatus Binatus sp.]|uniref:hypothetical protein n=1 Tax=Candidatus Binatus sp. TaxID=2811406 RepID=UPI003CC56765